ncbi:protein tamozhennic [Teleopsis dalmanni]|uniref:protein tamozhennic n=1 Tax=Teleopsis dalmanni TaxID=139649 RepID=UPI0018CFD3F2|nr:protein tamozhennic [Teleopsis dalmanni]XP_037954914.1 protein tamozhennic [Teleopsis dalmanni]
MSDFLSSDTLPDLWSEILNRHWVFLDTEESMQKLEERKKLEDCLKIFLSIVPHDRKFFLPETAHVLKQTVLSKDFTAYNAIMGFESVSQYANNLFAKPWRKEYRTLKMYSGFYKHEIESNLVDAVKLFEAMGYRRESNEVYVLEGPICPDQVTNVSRDAMAAYIECQIIKSVFTKLLPLGLNCSWQDVFNYREKYPGDSASTVKGISDMIEKRRLRREKLINLEDTYATNQHVPRPQLGLPNFNPQCQNCAHYHMTQQMLKNQCEIHNHNPRCAMCSSATQLNSMCNNMSGNKPKFISPYPVGNYQQHPSYMVPAQPHMSHSRSLDHYSEPHPPLPHRHSFDHQQQGCTANHYHQVNPHMQHLYESPYDCLDGVSMGSSASYAAVVAGMANCNLNGHPYNVSGNRYPLPHNLSSHLSSQYSMPINSNGVQCEPYDTADNTYAVVKKPNDYGYRHDPPPPLPLHHPSANSIQRELQTNKQRSFPQDQLISFDDRAPLTLHDFHAQQTYPQHNAFLSQRDRPYEIKRMNQQPSSSAQIQLSDDLNSSNLYALPVGTSAKCRSTNNMTENYIKNSDRLPDHKDNKRIKHMELKDHLNTYFNDRNNKDTEVNYDCSTPDDFVDISPSDVPQQSSTYISKSNEGVGSFEAWNYVYKQLDRSGYSKDLGDRGDLLVQSLDLDSLKLENDSTSGGEKGRSSQAEMKTSRQNSNEKSRTLEKATTKCKREKPNAKQEKSILKQQNANFEVGGNASTKKTKSALKQSMSTSVSNNNNIDSIREKANNDSAKRTIDQNNKQQKGNKARGNKEAIIAPQDILNNPNEWSCSFCTFINPGTNRICDMCAKTKDSGLKATVPNSRPTCV